MPKLYVNILGAKDKFKRKLRDKQPADDTYDEHSDSAGSYGAPDGDHVEGSARGIERLNSHRPSSAEIVPPPQHQHSSQGGNPIQWGAQLYPQPNQYQSPPTNQGSSYAQPTASNPQHSYSYGPPYGPPVNPSYGPPALTAAHNPPIGSSTSLPPSTTPQQSSNQGWGYPQLSAFPQTQTLPQPVPPPPTPAYSPQNPNYSYPPSSSYPGDTSYHHQQYPQSSPGPQPQTHPSYYSTPVNPPLQTSTLSNYNASNSNPPAPPTPSLQSSSSYGSLNGASPPPGQQNQHQHGTFGGYPPPQPGMSRTQTAPPRFWGGMGNGGSYPSSGSYQ